MNWGVIVSILFSVCSIAGLLIWLLYLIFHEEKIPSDVVQIDNYLTQYTNGRSCGILQHKENGSRRSIITYIPQDVDYKKISHVKPEKVVVENNKILTFAKGTWSNDITRKILLPPTPEDFPKEIKNTPYGKILMEACRKINEEGEEALILRKRIQAQTQLLEKTEGLGLVNDWMRQTDDIIEKIAKKRDDPRSNISSVVDLNRLGTR